MLPISQQKQKPKKTRNWRTAAARQPESAWQGRACKREGKDRFRACYIKKKDNYTSLTQVIGSGLHVTYQAAAFTLTGKESRKHSGGLVRT